jgi:phosphatidylethanolamine-binding protein (PEBP) family uncharacterized protein
MDIEHRAAPRRATPQALAAACGSGGGRKPPARRTLLAVQLAVAALVALSACGSSGKSTTNTSSSKNPAESGTSGAHFAPQQTDSNPHSASIAIVTTAEMSNGAIDPKHTCHGGNVSPGLRWKGDNGPLTKNKELMVFVRWVLGGKVQTGWAIAGLDPSLTQIAEGTTPPGAIVGRNSEGTVGYSFCPPKNAFVTMAVYALPHGQSLKTGFDASKLIPVLEHPEVQWGGTTMVAYVPPGAHH